MYLSNAASSSGAMHLRSEHQIRAVYHRVLWLEQSSIAAKLRFITNTLTRPVRVVVPAWKAAGEYGSMVADETRTSFPLQFVQMMILAVRHGFPPEAYYLCQLYRPRNRKNAANYLLSEEYRRLIQFLYRSTSPDKALINDKARFYEECRRHDLPTTPVIAEFKNGSLAKWHDATRESLPQTHLFSKPAMGSDGRGVAQWWLTADGRYRNDAGKLLTSGQLLEHLSRLSAKESQILQPKLSNHPAVGDLSSGALCTVRVVTFRRHDGQCEYLAASFRMPIGGSPADNFHLGGLASAVDERTGRLGPAVRRRPYYPYGIFYTHPNTGQRIDGFVLPYWKETVELCLRAQNTFADFIAVGWDVAITKDGPILMEGNYEWGMHIIQQSHDIPIGLTKLTELYLSYPQRPSPPDVAGDGVDLGIPDAELEKILRRTMAAAQQRTE